VQIKLKLSAQNIDLDQAMIEKSLMNIQTIWKTELDRLLSFLSLITKPLEKTIQNLFKPVNKVNSLLNNAIIVIHIIKLTIIIN
jgi:hypothetical protein